MNSLTRHMLYMATYHSDIYNCRTEILQQIFLRRSTWKDGRLGDTPSKKDADAQFEHTRVACIAQNKAMNSRLRSYLEERVKNSEGRPQEEIASLTASLGRITKRRIPRLRKLTRPEAEKLLRDVGLEGPRSRKAKRMEKLRHDKLKIAPRADTFQCYTYVENFDNVPVDVRPDWLAGLGETLHLVIKLRPEMAHKARAHIASLEARFGPYKAWGKLKRAPTPPKPVEEMQLGQLVRVSVPGEGWWAAYRPDIGPNVYESRNDAMSSIKVRLQGPCPAPELVPFDGKRARMLYGALMECKRQRDGRLRPICIIGASLIPVKETLDQVLDVTEQLKC